MILAVDINDQLGNQMFAYASIKSLALDSKADFRYILRDNDLINSSDSTYGHRFESLFPIDVKEKLSSDTIFEHIYNEPWPRPSNYQDSVYKINRDTLLKGHFQSPKYFSHRAAQVRDEWFKLPELLVDKMQKRKADLLGEGEWKGLISVHVRCGLDYSGRRLSRSYYTKAIQYIYQRFPKDNYRIVLFSDVPYLARLFLYPNNCVVNTGSLVDDLCLMSLCDAHIVSNSTFAWWGAWLSGTKNPCVCRPSIYPVGGDELYPEDIFPEEWVSVCATHMHNEWQLDFLLKAIKAYRMRKP